MNVDDEVIVYLNVPSDGFMGRIVEVNADVAKDIWYKVKPHGEGISDGKSFWHRENYVRRVDRLDNLSSIGDKDGSNVW